jgi:septal ring factor EnvC (AmiA/AmiB activator)
MKERVKGLLQKINFIETDMELQKQILFSIPSDQKDEMKKVMDVIASQKQQINELRLAIKEIDEDEYNRIISLEEATAKFRKLSQDKKFVKVHTLNEEGQCAVTLNDGTKIDCLVAAKDEEGNWTVLTIDAETREYPGGLIQE